MNGSDSLKGMSLGSVPRSSSNQPLAHLRMFKKIRPIILINAQLILDKNLMILKPSGNFDFFVNGIFIIALKGLV